MNLLLLLASFLQIGAFSIGGGYAAMPLIRAQTVTLHAWLTEAEFADLAAIAEMTPGPIALNAATFVGMRVAGAPGALVATFGCVLPSIFIVSLLAWLYGRYRQGRVMQSALTTLRPVVSALIASAAVALVRTACTRESRFFLPGMLMMLAAFALLQVKVRGQRPSPILVMLGCGGAGALLHALGIM